MEPVVSAEMRAILSPGERVVWLGGPELGPFLVPYLFLSFFGAIWMAFMLVGFGIIGPLILVIPHFWVGVALLLSPVYGILVRKYTVYVITDKRVIIQRGLIGRDFTSVDFDKIQNMDIDVGFLDRLFGTGTITFATAATPYASPYAWRPAGGTKMPAFRGIREPYRVFEKIKTVSFDVKTDIEYPNLYRPDVNPGYRTSYATPVSKEAAKVEVVPISKSQECARRYICKECYGSFEVQEGKPSIRCPYCGSGKVV